jgi:hypothetical protein
MTEEAKDLKIQPLTEEEIRNLADRLEKEEDFDSDLSRAVFTILVVGYEYQQLYTTLQAYYAASSGACYDLAIACAKVIGLRDHKKIMKLSKLAGDYAGGIPERAINLLQSELGQVTVEPTEETAQEAEDETTTA